MNIDKKVDNKVKYLKYKCMFNKIISMFLMVFFIFIGMTFVNAQDITPTITPSPSATPSPTAAPSGTPSADLICMQTAVEKRDNAIIAAWDNLSSSMKTALQTRRDALKSAWGISIKKDRNKAIRSAWTNFKLARRIARRNFLAARRTAWDQFGIGIKNCHVTSNPESRDSEVSL